MAPQPGPGWLAAIPLLPLAACALCGVMVVEGDLDLADGEVSKNPIGASVQDEGFDFGRLSDGVIYLENESNLDARAVPTPVVEAMDLIPGG